MHLASCGGAGSGDGAGHRRAEAIRGAFVACSQLLVFMAYEVKCSLLVSFVFAVELYLWNSLSLLGGALRSVGVESLAHLLALAVAVVQATDVQKRAGGLRSVVLWCIWSDAVALVAVAEAQATDVKKRAGVIRLGMLWCT